MSKITETIVRVDGKPVYSGSKSGARVAEFNAINRSLSEGRAEPVISVSERTVDYDLSDLNPKKVTEKTVTL